MGDPHPECEEGLFSTLDATVLRSRTIPHRQIPHVVRSEIIALLLAVIVVGSPGVGYFVGNNDLPSNSMVSSTSPSITVVSTSNNLFVGAIADNAFLYVGLINGTVLKMNPTTGQVLASVIMPDLNAPAHLLYYNGYLYVGTQFLSVISGARNTAPYDLYKVNVNTMTITASLEDDENGARANGLVMLNGGYLWVAEGDCYLHKISPSALSDMGSVAHAAEDELLFGAKYWWSQCWTNAEVQSEPTSTAALPKVIAAITFPRPYALLGYFQLDGDAYATNSQNLVLYRMTYSSSAGFKLYAVGKLANSKGGVETRDTFALGTNLYVYEAKWNGSIPASIGVYNIQFHPTVLPVPTCHNSQFHPPTVKNTIQFQLQNTIPLPGLALPHGASQHTMFLFNNRIYFVTQSAIGYFAPLSDSSLASHVESFATLNTFSGGISASVSSISNSTSSDEISMSGLSLNSSPSLSSDSDISPMANSQR